MKPCTSNICNGSGSGANAAMLRAVLESLLESLLRDVDLVFLLVCLLADARRGESAGRMKILGRSEAVHGRCKDAKMQRCFTRRGKRAQRSCSRTGPGWSGTEQKLRLGRDWNGSRRRYQKPCKLPGPTVRLPECSAVQCFACSCIENVKREKVCSLLEPSTQ